MYLHNISKASDPAIPTSVRQSLALDLEATRFTATAFAKFQHQLKTNKPVPDSGLPDLLTYDVFGLRSEQRQAGLRALDDAGLFALATMQSHCGHSPTGYAELKPFVEARLSESELYVQLFYSGKHTILANSLYSLASTLPGSKSRPLPRTHTALHPGLWPGDVKMFFERRIVQVIYMY